MEVPTSLGLAFRVESHYGLDHAHGAKQIGELLGLDRAQAATIPHFGDLSDLAHEGLAFVDTETTGLAGGAGTLVFLVGIGMFDQGGFRLNQYFLRHPDEEGAMLDALRQELQSAQGFVTFNGRAFDIPLLENRYIVGLRERWPLTRWPHLDLLHPARRLWKEELPDCTLGTIERQVLGVGRTERDVPGAEIPGLYLDYLRTGSGSEMERVIYHNAIDVLSLVSLTSHIVSRYQDLYLPALTASEAISVAGWHLQEGRTEKAESVYHAGLQRADGAIRLLLLRGYTAHLKSLHRFDDAVEGWRAWHKLRGDDPHPCIEIAKVYEWRLPDLVKAQRWARRGLQALDRWPPGWRREKATAEIQHRLARLDRKLSTKR